MPQTGPLCFTYEYCTITCTLMFSQNFASATDDVGRVITARFLGLGHVLILLACALPSHAQFKAIVRNNSSANFKRNLPSDVVDLMSSQ